ncbi:MAG: ABC transporter permease [Eubacterium sp.]|nr:ABC transporter permease [Eubacterium sp.]
MKKAFKTIYLIIILLFLYLPILTLVVLSFNESKSMFKWAGFSLKWYREMFSNMQILSALWNTFSIALCSSIIATIIGTLACVGIMSMGKRTQNFLMGSNQIQLLNADIVIGISLMLTFIVFGFYLNWGTVLLAHVTFSIPYVILSVMPKLKQAGKTHYEAALDLGATPSYAFRKVVIPEIRPGIVSGFLLAFTMSVDDFVVTHFTRGAGINTISTLIYSEVKVGIRPTLFALSTVIFVIVLAVLVAVNIAQAKKPQGSESLAIIGEAMS